MSAAAVWQRWPNVLKPLKLERGSKHFGKRISIGMLQSSKRTPSSVLGAYPKCILEVLVLVIRVSTWDDCDTMSERSSPTALSRSVGMIQMGGLTCPFVTWKM